MHVVRTHHLLERLSTSEQFLGILEKFHHRSALLNIKYNYAVLFLCQIYLLFVYTSKYIHIFSWTSIVEPWAATCDTPANVKIFLCSFRVHKGNVTYYLCQLQSQSYLLCEKALNLFTINLSWILSGSACHSLTLVCPFLVY